MLEAFGTGTACVISPVNKIYYKEDLSIPAGEDGKSGGIVANRLFKELLDIQHGVVDHPWSQIIN